MINDEKVYDGLRKNILRLRERHPITDKKITQQALADFIGIKRATLTNIELGYQRTPVYVIYRICDYFGVSLEDLMPKLPDVKAQTTSSQIDVGQQQHSLPEKASAALERARLLNSD